MATPTGAAEMSVKPRRQNAPIYTARDARRDAEVAQWNADHRRAVAEARAKVKHWEKLAATYGGDIHNETLARMRANLAKLEA